MQLATSKREEYISVEQEIKELSGKKRIEMLRALFVLWCTTPKNERRPRSQREFAKKFQIPESNLSYWKSRRDFANEVGGAALTNSAYQLADMLKHAETNFRKGSTESGKFWAELAGYIKHGEIVPSVNIHANLTADDVGKLLEKRREIENVIGIGVNGHGASDAHGD